MAYATPTHLLARYNANRLGQLVKDDGTTASSSQLLTDPNLQAALDDGAGQIEMACLAGNRYQQTDLQTLVAAYGLGPTSPQYNSGSLLVRLNCDLAYGCLVGRKGMDAATQQAMAPRSAWAESVLEQLRNGDRVFNVAINLSAGTPSGVDLSSERTLLPQYMDRYFGDLTTDPNNVIVR